MGRSTIKHELLDMTYLCNHRYRGVELPLTQGLERVSGGPTLPCGAVGAFIAMVGGINFFSGVTTTKLSRKQPPAHSQTSWEEQVDSKRGKGMRK